VPALRQDAIKIELAQIAELFEPGLAVIEHRFGFAIAAGEVMRAASNGVELTPIGFPAGGAARPPNEPLNIS
jgi:hypothetical protein